MTEYPQHRKKKERIAALLREQSNYQNVQVEKQTSVTVNGYPYTADVYAERISTSTNLIMAGVRPLVIHKIAVEVDGKRGHHGTIASRKDKLRDERLKEAGITTVRFPTKWLTGRMALSDDEILAYIDWTLKRC